MPTERHCMDLDSAFSVLPAQLDAVAISTRMWGLGVSYSSFDMDRNLVHVTQNANVSLLHSLPPFPWLAFGPYNCLRC